MDIDALYQGDLSPETRWNDAHARRERAQLFQTLTDAMAVGGWKLVRPAAELKVTLVLQESGFAIESEPLSGFGKLTPTLEVRIRSLAADIRPVASWLLQERVVREKQLERILAASESPPGSIEEAVISTAYNSLPPATRTAAERVSILRTEVPYDKALGPFKLRPSPSGGAESSVPKRELTLLLKAGFICERRVGKSRLLRMPRPVRQFLAPRARLSQGERVLTDHRNAARWSKGSLASANATIESHRHSVLGRDFEEAKATATYYAGDLRSLGYELSIDEQFSEAADVYKAIVEEFDDSDAYAWEYFGYNLRRAARGQIDDGLAARIEHAYEQALRHDPQNPLYHGRLLGFRAERGRSVVAEFNRNIVLYNGSLYSGWYAEKAVSYFAEPVIKALDRRSRSNRKAERQLKQITSRWSSLLNRLPRLAPFV